jgi:hypothetical protein
VRLVAHSLSSHSDDLSVRPFLAGPGKYELAKYSDFNPQNKGANRWSFGGKPRTRRDDITPGPDVYAHARTSFAGTRWTMAARFKFRDKEDTETEQPKDGKAVIVPAVKGFIGQGPKFSMAGRTRPIRSDQTPDATKSVLRRWSRTDCRSRIL